MARRTAQETRAAILQAVIELSGEMPPERLSTRAIAERAGVQQSVIYRHFGSRQALLDEASREFVRATARLVSGSLDIEESLWAGYEQVCAHPELTLRVARAVADGRAEELLADEPVDEVRLGNLLLLQLAVHRRTTPEDPVAHADLILLQCLLAGVALFAPYFLRAPVGQPIAEEVLEARLRQVLRALVDGAPAERPDVNRGGAGPGS